MMLMWITMIKMLMRMTRWNYNEGWSDWLKLLGAPAVAMSPSYVHPWSTFYTTFLFKHDQRSTQHFSPIMINVLHYTFLYDPSIHSTVVYVLWKVCYLTSRHEPNLKVVCIEQPHTTSHWRCQPNNVTLERAGKDDCSHWRLGQVVLIA